MEGYPDIIIRDGANLKDHDMSPTLYNFLSKVAQIYGKKIQVQCGTNHDAYSTSNKVSEHQSGNAADIYTYADTQGDDTETGDNIAKATFIAAGVEPSKALKMCKKGALRNLFTTKNRRIQVIWRINVYKLGGNHHNHVHIGIRARRDGDPPEGTIQTLT